MTERTLSARALNRALLARQLLLERSPLSIVDAIEQVGGLQTQYAPSGYIGLWTRLASFRRESLTDALEDRSVIQATLMRTTIHMVSAREYWSYAMGIRQARRKWALRLGNAPDPLVALDVFEHQVRELRRPQKARLKITRPSTITMTRSASWVGGIVEIVWTALSKNWPTAAPASIEPPPPPPPPPTPVA
jgi:hypothetical protein